MTQEFDIKEFHWLMDMLQTIDVGLVVLDDSYRIMAWNNFMENHSGLRADQVRDKVLFDLFSEIPREWFENKTRSVFLLKNQSFSNWEQRPYLFKFKNYRPITGTEKFMYQNLTISPIVATTGEVKNICLVIYDVTDVASNRKKLLTANAELQKLSRTDGLTGLHNRRYWQEQLETEFKRYQRTAEVSTLVMFDIDHFKRVNDQYGHPAGDHVIRQTATLLRKNMRDTDIAGRYGGEEFALILLNTGADAALVFAQRLRKEIAALQVIHEHSKIHFTVSLGTAELNSSVNSPEQWLELADSALYHAKQNGRNRVSTVGDF